MCLVRVRTCTLSPPYCVLGFSQCLYLVCVEEMGQLQASSGLPASHITCAKYHPRNDVQSVNLRTSREHPWAGTTACAQLVRQEQCPACFTESDDPCLQMFPHCDRLAMELALMTVTDQGRHTTGHTLAMASPRSETMQSMGWYPGNGMFTDNETCCLSRKETAE